MHATTRGTFRVLSVARDGGELRLLDRADGEPTLVQRDGYDGDLADDVAALRPGYVVDATLAWEDGTARFEAVDVTDRTLIEYVDGATGLFEAALDTMAAAERENEGVLGRPTYSTDGEPNGAVYVFAEQRGERDVFDEIRTGQLPLEPLVERLEDGVDDPTPHEIFVFRPADHDYVVVYLVNRKDSLLADTVRDTYDCPRPAEPRT